MVRRYTHRDYKLVKSWYKARNMPVPTSQMLSDAGWIVDEKIVGFLYLTNSSIAFIDGVISDPATLKNGRRQALRVLLGILIDSAVMMGYTTVLGATQHPSMKKQLNKLNFKPLQQELFFLQEKELDEAVQEYDTES